MKTIQKLQIRMSRIAKKQLKIKYYPEMLYNYENQLYNGTITRVR